MKGTKQSCQFQLPNFKYKFESFKNERNRTTVSFCNFGVFNTNSNLVVRERRLLQSFGVIVKERTKMEIIEKK